MTVSHQDSLRARLSYEPVPLAFGTSGRRGLVVHLTQFEVYLNALAELEYLQSLPPDRGGITRGDAFYFAADLRPSSSRFAPEAEGRGELAQAIERAIRDAGMIPVNLGCIPTPALTCHALERGKGSIMITGSHIPFDRNGYKTNTAKGELGKQDEAPINQLVEQTRRRLYEQPFMDSLFNERGMFKTGHAELSTANNEAHESYLRRYTDFFAGEKLTGRRLLVYQHSAVGRDLLVELLRRLGAEVIPAGRSETFVPIDTENIDAGLLAQIQSLATAAQAQHGPLDAVVSVDGDSDRPLLLGVEPATGPVRFFGGDLLGMVVAESLGADAVVVPVSCNDAVDRGALKEIVEPKTRIGSPFVIAGMEAARAKGKQVVCGWEANGGFLTGSDIKRNGNLLTALPTRDAMLPLLATLFRSVREGRTVCELFDRLPKRFSKAGLLKNFPRPVSLKIIAKLRPLPGDVVEIQFNGNHATFLNAQRQAINSTEEMAAAARQAQTEVARYFGPVSGFGQVSGINYTDGTRIFFDNGDVAHIRPSGNADELRIYAVADAQTRADDIVRQGIAEPDGILRRLERAVQ